MRIPAPSALVVVGLAVGLVPGMPATRLAPELVILGVLPPLLFAAAEQVSLPELARVWRPVTALASGLVALTAVAVALVTRAVDPSIGLAAAFTLGAVLASTDPVAVTALSRQLRLPPRIATLVQAESLFNDATSLVLFQVAVAATVSGRTGFGAAALDFLRLGGGGVALGVAVGELAWLLLRPGARWAVAAVALLTPYAAALAAEAIGVSSVTAVIVAGLMIARRRGRDPLAAGRQSAEAVYRAVVLVLENGIFAVIGLELATFVRDLPAGQRATAAALAGLVTATLLGVRALALGGIVALPATLRRQRGSGATYRPWRAAAVVTWAGTRGAVPLAAALSVPATVDSGAPFPHRALLLVVATAAVVITLVVQGTTLQPLIRRLGVSLS
jgi:Na+/H+ antiporter